MSLKLSGQVKWFVVISAVITIVLVNILILTAQDNNQYNSEPLSRPEWFAPYGLIIEDEDVIFPVITYDNTSGSFIVVNQEKCNIPVYVENLFSKDLSDPDNRENLWYTPNISIKNNKLGIDYLIYDGTGVDCGYAEFNVTLKAYEIKSNCIDAGNVITGPDIDYDDGLTVYTGRINVSDLKNGEYREYRIISDLFMPNSKKSYLLELTVHSPEEFTDTGNIFHKIEDLCPECESYSYQKSDVNLILNASDGFNMPCGCW
ncbi:hypothetical protein J2128_001826 [Methanomicrobium sp. W14]|uniref:hypothetical protein n=1 Tax=Methanomicrobium sp. W14 TaxID=2817839 RepID=UPI001AEB1AB9|nr:hypothetical protein [Methanomicrobium sp. W14]MBP2133872.1 hypothetical protein [Methanomicrobium sp. W14]